MYSISPAPDDVEAGHYSTSARPFTRTQYALHQMCSCECDITRELRGVRCFGIHPAGVGLRSKFRCIRNGSEILAAHHDARVWIQASGGRWRKQFDSFATHNL
jgi:hypothetical protein